MRGRSGAGSFLRDNCQNPGNQSTLIFDHGSVLLLLNIYNLSFQENP
jgi:hypothetical protein